MTTDRPTLQVIPGTGEHPGTSYRGDLVAVEEHVSHVEQLSFGFWSAPSQSGRLLSVGLEGLSFRTFRALLSQGGVNFIVDVRNLASFRGKGFSSRTVETTFSELGVHYERFYDLMNPFLGLSQNKHAVLHQYSKILKERSSSVFPRLISLISRGTVLLLGRESNHFGSERQIVVDMLVQYERSLEVLTIASKGLDLVHWSTFKIRSNDSLPPKRSARARGEVSQQLRLPEPVSEDD